MWGRGGKGVVVVGGCILGRGVGAFLVVSIIMGIVSRHHVISNGDASP